MSETLTPLHYDSTATIVLAENIYAEGDARKPYVKNAREISATMNTLQATSDTLARRNKQIRSVEEYIKGIVSANDGEVDDEIQTIADLLDIDLTRRIRVELSFQVTAYLEVPIGVTADDIRSYDFGIDGLDYQGGDGEIVDWSCDDNDLISADFDE